MTGCARVDGVMTPLQSSLLQRRMSVAALGVPTHRPASQVAVRMHALSGLHEVPSISVRPSMFRRPSSRSLPEALRAWLREPRAANSRCSR